MEERERGGFRERGPRRVRQGSEVGFVLVGWLAGWFALVKYTSEAETLTEALEIEKIYLYMENNK